MYKDGAFVGYGVPVGRLPPKHGPRWMLDPGDRSLDGLHYIKG